MTNYFSRHLNRKLELVLLTVVLVEILILAWVMFGVKNDLNDNFHVITDKLEQNGDGLETLDGKIGK